MENDRCKLVALNKHQSPFLIQLLYLYFPDPYIHWDIGLWKGLNEMTEMKIFYAIPGS